MINLLKSRRRYTQEKQWGMFRWKMQNSKWLLKSGRIHEATMSKKKKEYVQEKLKTLKIEDRKQ